MEGYFKTWEQKKKFEETARNLIEEVEAFEKGSSEPEIGNGSGGDYYSEIGHLLHLLAIAPARVTFSFPVHPSVCHYNNGLHGRAVAAVAERVAITCARTLLPDDHRQQLFLNDLGISFLSFAPLNAELIVDGSVVKTERNLIVVSVEFRLKDMGQLFYTAQATLINPAGSRL